MKNVLSDAYYDIEKSIVKNSRGVKISASQMSRIYGDVVVLGNEFANKLLAERLRQNPKLKGKIDDCWLRIFSVAIVSYCWASAVSRGKAFDRKRNKKGRLGWIRKHEELPALMNKAYYIGEEIVNQRLSNDRDFNNAVELERLTKALVGRYAK